MTVVKFIDTDYERVLRPLSNSWSLEATRHLLELCERFDLRSVWRPARKYARAIFGVFAELHLHACFRWPVIVDRFDQSGHNASYSMEDMKEWYYKLTTAVKRDQRIDEPPFYFDADNERRRKEQLHILLNRTEAEVYLTQQKIAVSNEARF